MMDIIIDRTIDPHLREYHAILEPPVNLRRPYYVWTVV